jgi:hypothetical protein
VEWHGTDKPHGQGTKDDLNAAGLRPAACARPAAIAACSRPSTAAASASAAPCSRYLYTAIDSLGSDSIEARAIYRGACKYAVWWKVHADAGCSSSAQLQYAPTN